jgi:nucleoside-diphosphate-sugar epimerase
MSNVVIIGCGDVGKRVGAISRARGLSVSGLVRSPESAEALRALAIEPLLGNLDSPESLPTLPLRGSILFYFAPPPGGGFTDPRARAFASLVTPEKRPARIIYLSTSGVYGDCGDALVDEDSPPAPVTSRGKRRLDAEEAFRALGKAHGVPVIILRVTGIYGPGKLPVSQLMAGLPVLREEESCLTNRIHVEDLARVCVAAADHGQDGDLYNVSDGHPTTMTSYFMAVARTLGLPPPATISREEAQRTMPPLMLSYFSESRRIDNRRMLEKLKVSLLYPALEQGLQASLPPEAP